MMIQYSYALSTMIPCPLWFWYRWFSAGFLFTVFAWSIYNGATYYIDVFGNRFQNELEQLRKDVAKWQLPTAFGDDGMNTPAAKAENALSPLSQETAQKADVASSRAEAEGASDSKKEQ